MHDASHPKAGQTVTLKSKDDRLDGQEYRIEDWTDRVGGRSWREEKTPAAMIYSVRASTSGIPLDEEVVYGKIGSLGHMVHQSEIDGSIDTDVVDEPIEYEDAPTLEDVLEAARGYRQEALDADDNVQARMTFRRFSEKPEEELSITVWLNDELSSPEEVGSQTAMMAVPAFGFDMAVFISDAYGCRGTSREQYEDLIATLNRDHEGSMQKAVAAGRKEELNIIEAMQVCLATRTTQSAAVVCVTLEYDIDGYEINWKAPEITTDISQTALGRVPRAMERAFQITTLLDAANALSPEQYKEMLGEDSDDTLFSTDLQAFAILSSLGSSYAPILPVCDRSERLVVEIEKLMELVDGELIKFSDQQGSEDKETQA